MTAAMRVQRWLFAPVPLARVALLRVVVYAFVVVMTIVPALGDMVVAFPSVVSASAFGKLVATWRDLLPLSGLGLSWVVPALVGLVLGLGVHAWRVRQAATSEVVD